MATAFAAVLLGSDAIQHGYMRGVHAVVNVPCAFSLEAERSADSSDDWSLVKAFRHEGPCGIFMITDYY